ncbi:MAG: helix-turn-helix transcriptional regulator [Pseudonocardiaceae bacterium]
MAALNPRRARLAATLKRLRQAAMTSGSEMARRTGWVQPKVSRLETGAQLPTEDDLRTWAQHTGASTEQTEALLDMLSAARVEYTPTADLLTRGALARRQAHLGAMEAAATRIGEYQPAFLPGLVQTPAYTRALLELPGSARSKGASDTELERIVAARGKRQALLSEPGRRWQFVIGETALWSSPGTTEIQLEQLDHLVTVREVPGVEIAVIPLRAPMPVLPLSGFRLLDDEFVFVESLAGEQRLDDPEEIAPIIRAFEVLRDAGVTGGQALALIQRVAAELRR